MATQVGQLDQRITLQRRVGDKDSLGTRDYTFENLPRRAKEWARAQPLRGREFFAAGEMQSEVTVKFTIGFRDDLDPTMRVLWRGKPYDIAVPPIDVDGLRVWTELMCKNGVGDGR